MKLQLSTSANRSGFTLIMVLIMVGVSLLIMAAVMNRTSTVANLNARNDDYVISCNAAESAVEKAYAHMAYDFKNGGLYRVGQDLETYRTNLPSSTENAYWSNFKFSDGNGNQNQTYVAFAYNFSGPLPSAFVGLSTTNAPVYRIVSNATITDGANSVTGTAQEDVLLALVPLSTWAIFYNGLLEFTQCATMSVNGRVHANGSIYVGTTASLAFNSGVSTTGTLTAPNNVDGLAGVVNYGTSDWNTTFNNSPAYTTNTASVTVSLAMTNSHALIDIPPDSEDPTSLSGQQRLYNEAEMVLIVTNPVSGNGNPTVILTMQTSVNGAVPGDDSSKVILILTNASSTRLATNFPFLDLDNSAYDQRERKTNILTDIDVGRFATWSETNKVVQNKLPSSSYIYPNILYVADRRNANAHQLPSVRLNDAKQLPSNGGSGFSVATMNPLYIYGDYNVQLSSSGPNSLNTSDTTYTVPAALLSDSLTILSPNWSDSASFSTYSQNSSSFDAGVDTTVNAAIVTGAMPTTGTTDKTFSGGVHNLPRLLQDWSTRNLWLNTSILRLWDSEMATNQFRNPAGFNPSPVNPYYNPPTRKYAFDSNFLNPSKVPPGIPTVLVPIRFAWYVPPPNVITNPVGGHN